MSLYPSALMMFWRGIVQSFNWCFSVSLLSLCVVAY